ncbi:MAG: heparinase II/III domain-containing protein, partial [Armatimonadota bacterium]
MPTRTAFMAALMIGATMTVGYAKNSATFYTPERVAIARENVERYEWAQEELRRILEGQPRSYVIGHEYTSAKEYAAQSDEFMWELQPPTTIPRIYPHEARSECPVHGTEIRRHNAFHPWRIDPINHPYQIQCMEGGEWYPSNDFASGDMTSGDYPDDGDGWVAPDGRRFYFIREYVATAYTAVTIPTLNALSRAWLLTGDEKYAHKCAVLLARLASEYPNHDDRQDRLWAAPYGGRHPHYEWKGGGMITDLIWETFCTEDAVLAYDAIYEYLDDDPELIAFVQQKGIPVEDADDLREYIEHYLLRAAAVALQNGAIKGNEGHHQALAMTIALVLDDYSDERPNSRDMVDYAYHGTGHCAYIMPNYLRRDGGGHESPNYSRIKTDFIRVARLMEEIRAEHPDEFGHERYPDIFGGDKARAMFDWFIDCKMLDYYTPGIGDSGGIRTPRRVGPQNFSFIGGSNLYAFEKYGDPVYARASTRADGTWFPGELFWEYPGDELEAALADPASQIARESRLLDGYGTAIFESGGPEDRRAVCLNYAATVGHRQMDNLNLEVFARGVDMLPDLGYPFTWDYRWEWDSNIMAHNTVSVGESHADIRRRTGNASWLFASEDGVHAVTASHDPYPEGYGHTKEAAPDVDLYERTVVMVDIDPERFYVLDLFAVRGGDQHDQSWHGPLTTPTDPALEWDVQETGTLAGPDVEQFEEYTDRWGRTLVSFPSFVKDVRRATLTEPATWHWDYGLDEGDALNLHLLPVGGPMEVIRCTGRSPARPSDWALDYLFARRRMDDGSRSL